MKRSLLRYLASVTCVVLLAGLAEGADASPVTSRFNGTVSGYNFGFLDPSAVAFDDDHAIGTAVQWDLTFDDSFLGLDLSGLLGRGPLPVSGSLQVGADTYAFTEMRFFSLMLGGGGSTISAYGPQVFATGPGTSDGGDFFSMFWSFAPDLSMLNTALIGYSYAYGSATVYGYLETAGEYSVGPAAQVPEPATMLLVLAALVLLHQVRRVDPANEVGRRDARSVNWRTPPEALHGRGA